MLEGKEIKGIIQMLNATAEMAEHASMTGSMAEGQKAGIRQYNNVLKHLQETDTVSEGLFVSVEEDASFDELGVCCSQLAAYLDGMTAEPKIRHGRSGNVNAPYINMAGCLPDMQKMGDMIRNAMPSWIREQMEKEEPEEEEQEDKEPEADMNDLESRIAELGAQMQVLAERMHREELSSDEIRKLADQMRELGQQQSELARQHAVIRTHKDTGKAAQSDS